MEGDAPRAADGRSLDPRQLLEVHAFLACQGPEAFQPSVAWFRLMPDARQGALVDWLLDPANRAEASALLGREWGGVLEASNRDGFARMGALLPCLACCDAALGFRVLQATAEAVGPAARKAYGEALLALVLSRAVPRTGEAPEPASGNGLLEVLLHAMARLPLDAEGQARRFLALTQAPLHEAALAPVFPEAPEAQGLVLAEGHPRAIECLLRGVLERSGGKAEFFAACKTLVARGLDTAIPALGHAMEVIGHHPVLEPLEALLRAALLPTLERTPADLLGLAIPAPAAPGTLHLVAQVVPGLPPDRRLPLCDLLLERSAQALQDGRVGTAEAPLFVETVVQAAVLHPDSGRAAERVRRMLLDGASLFRVQLFSSSRPREDLFDAAMAFEQVVGDLEAEFRRRRSLAFSLDSVMPMVRSLANPPQIPWAE